MGSAVKTPKGKALKGEVLKKPATSPTVSRADFDYGNVFDSVGGLEEAKKLGFVEHKDYSPSSNIFVSQRRERVQKAREWVERYNSPEEKSKRTSQAEANTQGEARGEAEVVSSDSRETNSDGLGIEGDVGSPRKKKKQIARSGLGI